MLTYPVDFDQNNSQNFVLQRIFSSGFSLPSIILPTVSRGLNIWTIYKIEAPARIQNVVYLFCHQKYIFFCKNLPEISMFLFNLINRLVILITVSIRMLKVFPPSPVKPPKNYLHKPERRRSSCP